MATQYELINENKRLSDENDDLRRSKTELETRLRLYDVCEECKAIDALRFVLGVEEDKELKRDLEELERDYHNTKDEAINEDLGFQVIVRGAKERYVDGKPEYNIDISKLGDIMYEVLITKPSRFTKAELRFIIEKTDVTIYDFSDAVYMKICDLEYILKSDSISVLLCWSTEKLIRLFMAQYTVKNKSDFMDIYLSLESIPNEENAPFIVDGKLCELG